MGKKANAAEPAKKSQPDSKKTKKEVPKPKPIDKSKKPVPPKVAPKD